MEEPISNEMNNKYQLWKRGI